MKMNVCASGATVTTELAFSPVPGKPGAYMALDVNATLVREPKIDFMSETSVNKQGVRRMVAKADTGYRMYDAVSGVKSGATRRIGGTLTLNLDYDTPIASAADVAGNATDEARAQALSLVIQMLVLSVCPGANATMLRAAMGQGVTEGEEAHKANSLIRYASYGVSPINETMVLGVVDTTV